MIRTTFGKIAIGQVFASCTSSKPCGRYVRLRASAEAAECNVCCLDDGTLRVFHDTTAVAVEDRRAGPERRQRPAAPAPSPATE